MFVIDRYAYNNRWTAVPELHKFSLYILLMIISFSGFLPLQILLIVIVVPLTCYIARLPILKYLSWFRYPSIFILLSMATFVISYGENSHQFLMAIPVGSHGYLGVFHSSAKQVGPIVMRIYCSLISTYFMALTIPFNQMMKLCKTLHLPAILMELIVLMYRFIFLVLIEFLTIRDTLDLKFSFVNKKKSYLGWGRLANTLFVKLLADNQRLNDVLTLKFAQAKEIDEEE
ncbi:CbiQ family ECF transporter T component [Streptococcus parasanguinis]|jgi:cbiQ protein, putative|uniref:CbiQ family ECF transporter T component n=1 Tax=Streptococcus parasanguinis TaxID=1318 RepID=UPI00066E304A|nr:CbiQ family ECF transporter T component [Streptococcus parasanguinis]